MKKSAEGMVLLRWLVFLMSLGWQASLIAANAHECPETAQQYWKAFRISVLDNDLTAIASASRFPFLIRGTLDESESRHVDRQEFGALFSQLRQVDPGLSPVPTTMQSLILATVRLPPASCNAYGNQFRVGAWVFELTADGWRFVEGFVADD